MSLKCPFYLKVALINNIKPYIWLIYIPSQYLLDSCIPPVFQYLLSHWHCFSACDCAAVHRYMNVHLCLLDWKPPRGKVFSVPQGFPLGLSTQISV